MKKTLLLLVSLLLAAFLFGWGFDVWQTTDSVRENGKTGTLRIGRLYNSSHWAKPLPLKKIHVYTATLAPAYEVVITSDQELIAGRQYFIHFLGRDQLGEARGLGLRPLTNSVRLRQPTDETPTAVESTAALDRLVDKAMGNKPTQSPSVKVNARAGESVPFLIGDAEATTGELIWNNSAAGEWIFALVLLLLTKALLASAWFTPWRERRRQVSEEKDFVHPSLRHIEADTLSAGPRRIPMVLKVSPPPVEPSPPVATSEDSHPPLKLPRK